MAMQSMAHCYYVTKVSGECGEYDQDKNDGQDMMCKVMMTRSMAQWENMSNNMILSIYEVLSVTR